MRDLGGAVGQLVPQGAAAVYGSERVERERDGGGEEAKRDRERGRDGDEKGVERERTEATSLGEG